MAILWLAVLPRLAQSPAFAAQRADLAERGIDSAAVFYTDHPFADGLRTPSR
ncbi:MAG: hypothetical protein AAF805_08115 [Planctomycetota bacterium]